MAANRRQAHALDNSARWLGGGAVALLHLLGLLAFLATDRLAQRKLPEPPPLILYHIPDKAGPAPPPSGGAPSRILIPAPVRVPDLPSAVILVAPMPDQPLSVPRGLDLSIHSDAKKSLDDLAPPSRERQLKQFFLDSAAEGRQAQEPSAGKDCEPAFARDQDAASLPTSPIKSRIPIWNECLSRKSAQDLARRNDRFSPK